jgi:hypothetical protein
MRVTLTIDDDVAVSLERLRKARDGSLKALINEALRRGIKDMNARGKPHRAFRTRAVDVGEVLIPLDNINEALAFAEREPFK